MLQICVSSRKQRKACVFPWDVLQCEPWWGFHILLNRQHDEMGFGFSSSQLLIISSECFDLISTPWQQMFNFCHTRVENLNQNNDIYMGRSSKAFVLTLVIYPLFVVTCIFFWTTCTAHLIFFAAYNNIITSVFKMSSCVCNLILCAIKSCMWSLWVSCNIAVNCQEDLM